MLGHTDKFFFESVMSYRKQVQQQYSRKMETKNCSLLSTTNHIEHDLCSPNRGQKE